jgi:hypothetical protein
MEQVVRTVWGSNLQASEQLGLPYTVRPFTTLNEKLGIQSGVSLAPGVYPKVQYYCYGNGGHQMTMGADNIPLSTIAQHRATDAALFKQLPFVLRPIASDLTLSERVNYALRIEEQHGGATYVAYYLKRIDLSSTFVQMDYRTIVNGVVTSTPYVPDAANLSPTPIVISNGGVNTVSGDYITCAAQLPLAFSPAEVADLINVSTVLHGVDDYAIISEIGLCSGGDKTITVTPSTGGSFNFNEAVGVQIASFVSCLHIAKYATSGITKQLDFGVNDPLFNIS